MKTFRMKADVTFEAQDIDDAFIVLSRHFNAMAETGLDEECIFITGKITIEPESA